MYDIIIIGAGVTGCAIANELSKYNIKICVIEKESDVCEGTSKANSGIIHAGFDAQPGTLKARLNVRGSQMMQELSQKLDFAYRNNQALVLCFNEADRDGLVSLYNRGISNGVEGLEIIEGDRVRELEPAIGDNVVAALLAKSSAIACPFEMTIAFAENAYANGVEFVLGNEVVDITQYDAGFKVSTISGKEDKKDFESKLVINAAGVYADRIHQMVSAESLSITPRRGEYYLMDKEVGTLVDRTIFQLPTKLGKGVLISPTAHGNLIVGPTAENIEDKEDTATTAEGLADIKSKAALSVSGLPMNKAITNFSGLRAVGDTGDFIIQESDISGFIDVAGIESPGLSSAPAIGEYVADIVRDIYSRNNMNIDRKTDYIDERKGLVHFASLSIEEQNELISQNPSYGNIVCRCESVTEGEIEDAINRPLGATTLDAVKRRTRAGMGRCQAGFCSPKVMGIIAKKLKINLTEVDKR